MPRGRPNKKNTTGANNNYPASDSVPNPNVEWSYKPDGRPSQQSVSSRQSQSLPQPFQLSLLSLHPSNTFEEEDEMDSQEISQHYPPRSSQPRSSVPSLKLSHTATPPLLQPSRSRSLSSTNTSNSNAEGVPSLKLSHTATPPLLQPSRSRSLSSTNTSNSNAEEGEIDSQERRFQQYPPRSSLPSSHEPYHTKYLMNVYENDLLVDDAVRSKIMTLPCCETFTEVFFASIPILFMWLNTVLL